MAEISTPHIPEGLWLKCPDCKETLFARELERNGRICPYCQHHFPLSAQERIELLLEGESWRPLRSELSGARLGIGTLEGIAVALGAVDPLADRERRSPSELLGALLPLLDRAARARHPLILCVPGGYGLSVKEPLPSGLLVAWHERLNALGDRRLPYLLVITDPSPEHGYRVPLPLGDVVIGEAAPEEVPPLGSPAEGKPAAFPFVDRFVIRSELRADLIHLVTFFTDPMRVHG
ncbi:MAG: hypothetical protein KatS3mg115_1210 [Candidatus Poribacteria bacterium]|nr:MAG: hypothetical protein KatS3mg115_1210 [Candidatus Poribacteria bacterium]